MKRAIVTGLAVAAVLAPAGSSGPATPPPFPYCVVKVWEDGSAAFRDAEAVRADAACYRAVNDYIGKGKG